MHPQATGTTQAADPTREIDSGVVRRAVTASAMGNAMEWYDYGVFTAGAITTTIGALFFPGSGNAVLKSFVLLAASFIVRPFGGAIFGPLGDKIGRRRVLAATMLLMSGGTFLVGVLPTYSGPYSIGIGASVLVLVLRLVQGFSTGGEYGGAATFIAEYAPTRRRGFFGSFLEFGTLSGFILGNVVVLAITLGLGSGSPAFQSWGWRIPFLLALPLGLVGLYLRMRLEDTPTFQALAKAGRTPDRAPFRETVTRHWRMILNLIGVVLLLNVADYTVLTTMPTYITAQLHFSTTTSTLVIIGAELLQMALISPLGALSDRIGRKPLLYTAAIGYIVLSYPAFWLMHTRHLAGLVAGFVILAVLLVCILAVIGSTFPAMFPTRVRYGSFAIGYNLSTSIFGGTAGLVIETLITLTGNTYVPAYYLMGAGVIGLIPVMLMPETSQVPMTSIEA
jgi:MHS family proline/betaine transporter-like MFS transporter